MINLENAVENHFTAKTPRAQRTYSRDKTHPIGEDLEHTRFHSNPCFSYVPQRGIASLRLCVFAVEVLFQLRFLG
jgi:hypothetical protein